MGDIDKLVSDNIREFLNSDMSSLSPEQKLTFKQMTFNPKNTKRIIDKIIYHDNKMTIFININALELYKNLCESDYINEHNLKPNFYISNDKKYAVIETDVYLHSHSCINNPHSGGGVSIITRDETTTILIRALAYGWRYKRQMAEKTGINQIATLEKRTKRTIYKYMNLCYLSPRIINDIMAGKVPRHINLQKLIEIASKHEKFEEQEKMFYN